MANTTGKKYGGRKKGTPNKQTKEIRDAYKILIETNLDNMTKWINSIAKENPEKAIDILLKLSEYVVPKLNRIETKDITTLEHITAMTPEQRKERIAELIEKAQKNDKQQRKKRT